MITETTERRNWLSFAATLAILAVAAPSLAAGGDSAAPSARQRGATCQLELESPLVPYRRARPEGRVLAAAHDEQLARWNIGGSSDASHPSNRPGYHPGTRVVVDATVLGVWGRTASIDRVHAQLQARIRSKAYWDLRICHEASLRDDQTLHADLRLRVTADSGGTIRAVRVLHSETSEPLVACVQGAVSSLQLGTLAARRIDAEIRVRLWPGDAPVPLLDPPTEREDVPAEVQHQLDVAQEKWRAARDELQRCAVLAERSDPRLWGRIQLLMEFDATGRVVSAAEHESQFPNADVTACVKDVASHLQLGAGHGVSLLFALRIGSPPDGAPETENAKAGR